EPQSQVAVRSRRWPADLPDPYLGRLSRRRGVCRVVDEPHRTRARAPFRSPTGAVCAMNTNVGILILVLLAGLGATATFLVQQVATPRIAAEQRAIQNRNLLEMLPQGSYDNQPLDQPLSLTDVELGSSRLLGGYLATQSGQPSAVILYSQTVGYAGPIELLIGIGANGKLLGIKTLKQSETPGL